MAISAADVKKLRDQTGAGMMDCKAALEEANGNFEEANDGSAQDEGSPAPRRRPDAPRPKG